MSTQMYFQLLLHTKKEKEGREDREDNDNAFF